MVNLKPQQLGLGIFVATVVWGPVVSGLHRQWVPDADLLQIYLLNKGLFVGLLLLVMSQFGGLAYFGFRRRWSWWFLIASLPILLLTVAVGFAPNASFGLGLRATIGWVVVALLVGIGEEGVFRGVLWRSLEPRGALVTAIATSALFGAVHLIGLLTDLPWQVVVSQAVFAFGVGMVFAAVRLVSGSLWAPIALHAAFDAAAILAAGGVQEMLDDTLTPARLLIPGALFAAWGLVSLVVIDRRRLSHPNARPAGQPDVIVP